MTRPGFWYDLSEICTDATMAHSDSDPVYYESYRVGEVLFDVDAERRGDKQCVPGLSAKADALADNGS